MGAGIDVLVRPRGPGLEANPAAEPVGGSCAPGPHDVLVTYLLPIGTLDNIDEAHTGRNHDPKLKGTVENLVPRYRILGVPCPSSSYHLRRGFVHVRAAAETTLFATVPPLRCHGRCLASELPWLAGLGRRVLEAGRPRRGGLALLNGDHDMSHERLDVRRTGKYDAEVGLYNAVRMTGGQRISWGANETADATACRCPYGGVPAGIKRRRGCSSMVVRARGSGNRRRA